MSTIIQADRAEWLAECRWFVDSGHEWLQVPLWAAREADQADDQIDGPAHILEYDQKHHQ